MAVKKTLVSCVVTEQGGAPTMSAAEIDGQIVHAMGVGDLPPGVGVKFWLHTLDVAGIVGKAIPKGQKYLIYGVDGYKTVGDGGAGDKVDIKKGTSLICSVDLNKADKLVLSVPSIDDANNVLDGDAGDTLNFVVVDGNAGATDLSCELMVKALRIA